MRRRFIDIRKKDADRIIAFEHHCGIQKAFFGFIDGGAGDLRGSRTAVIGDTFPRNHAFYFCNIIIFNYIMVLGIVKACYGVGNCNTTNKNKCIFMWVDKIAVL